MLLESFILHVINEQKGKTKQLNPKIESLVKKFENFILQGKKIFITVEDTASLVEIKLIETIGFVDEVHGIVRFQPIDEKIANKVKGRGDKTKGAWSCCGAKMSKDLNLGPLLYEVGMEYIGYKYKCAIMSDIRHKEGEKINADAVSDQAINVWNKYMERSSGKEVSTYQFDISKEEKEEKEESKSIKINQITPDNDNDDLESLSLDLISKRGQKISGTNWSNSSLTKSFFKGDGRLITYLLDCVGKKRIFMK